MTVRRIKRPSCVMVQPCGVCHGTGRVQPVRFRHFTQPCQCCRGKGWYWTVQGDTAKELEDGYMGAFEDKVGALTWGACRHCKRAEPDSVPGEDNPTGGCRRLYLDRAGNSALCRNYVTQEDPK